VGLGLDGDGDAVEVGVTIVMGSHAERTRPIAIAAHQRHKMRREDGCRIRSPRDQGDTGDDLANDTIGNGGHRLGRIDEDDSIIGRCRRSKAVSNPLL
jgi:hypothetical protein